MKNKEIYRLEEEAYNLKEEIVRLNKFIDTLTVSVIELKETLNHLEELAIEAGIDVETVNTTSDANQYYGIDLVDKLVEQLTNDRFI